MSLDAPFFTAQSRLMVIAPHPDDESLACSIVVQRAVRAGARVRVTYATDGDNNPWPQRAIERKWCLTEFDRARWGQLRRKEALNALEVLGVGWSDADFLALPDQGLTDLLLAGCPRTLQRLTHCIAEWAPTDLIVPDMSDIHPDHNALALMLRLVLENLSPDARPSSSWSFVVHGKSEDFMSRATALRQTPEEAAVKIAAIGCHNTQLKLSCGRFMAYAARPEHCLPLEVESCQPASGCLRNAWRDSGNFVVTVPVARRRFLPGRANLLFFGREPAGRQLCARIPVENSADTSEMFDCATGASICRVQTDGNLLSGLNIAIPRSVFSSDDALYLKLERRRIFFDEAGWIELAAQMEAVPAASDDIHGELLVAAG